MKSVLAALALCAVAGTASAQAWTHPGGSAAAIHRDRIERVWDRSAEQASFARQSSLNTRFVDLGIQNARDSTVQPSLVSPVLRAPDSNAWALPGAAERRRTVSRRVGEIDSWLDRGPR
jgi:hypothetical protein